MLEKKNNLKQNKTYLLSGIFAFVISPVLV